MLFAIGSTCFALGSVPIYFGWVSPTVLALTFFVGSIFFTSAATLQFRDARGTDRVDEWASGVQLVGTVWFNVSTLAAGFASLSLERQRHLIWAPDVIGSICFLVASVLACIMVSPILGSAKRRGLGWWIAAANMIGSIAFGASAIAARYLPTTGEVANIQLVNAATCLGAVCFFIGAVLLILQARHERHPAVVPA